MKSLAVATVCFALAGSWVMGGAARAADYYIVYVSTDPDDYWLELIDPATIATDPNGHRTVTGANIRSMDLWNDETYEFDCSTQRYRTVSSISHLAGGSTLDRSTIAGLAIGEWVTAQPGDLALLTHDVVCQWSSDKMTGDAVYSAPDFPTAESRISDRIFELEQKQK